MEPSRTLTTDVGRSPFAAEHARILRGMERGGVLELPAPGALRERYAPHVCEAAVATWRDRMVNEHRSASVFASLVPQLIEASTTVDVQTVALQAATEEIRHAVLCGEVVRAFGGEPVTQAEAVLPRIPEHAGVAALERVLRNMMFVGCLAETVAVALITEERELAQDPFVRAVFDRILPDEVSHARMGWLFLAQHLASLDGDARGRLERYLRVAFAYFERRELALLPLTPPGMPAELRAQREAIGLCEGEAAQTLFRETVEGVIIPRLEDMGLGARRAWRERAEA